MNKETETRTQTIIRNTRLWAHGRDEYIKILTHRVMDLYHAMVPAQQRKHAFSNTGNALRDQVNNKKFIERCINGEIRFPADMEEAWVMALDNPFRARLVSELARRYGLLAVYEADISEARSTLVGGARLMHETSEALEVVARMELDGVIDGSDFPLLHVAVSELDDVASCALTMKRLLAHKLTASAPVTGVHARH